MKVQYTCPSCGVKHKVEVEEEEYYDGLCAKCEGEWIGSDEHKGESVVSKKTVKFKSVLGMQEHPSGAMQAVLSDVSGHYRLGNQAFVTTSAVVKIDYDDNREATRIETLNTIYEKE